ncbi:chorion peroxidase-like [Macrobrachium rosenbergii]|uniref:chorion peroxidase-like n=1 Tax=Macrobrachium rosenbergii TaxID=79674 RepID=UPI0034D74FDB
MRNFIINRSAGNKGEKSFDTLKRTDTKLKEMGLYLNRNDPGLKNFKADPVAKNNSRVGFIMEEATRIFKKKLSLSDKAVTVLVLLKKIRAYLEGRYSSQLVTPRQSSCNPLQPYRTLNGSCNNLQDARRGSTFMKFRRILFPDYFKGVSELRRDQNGDPLPSTRFISTRIDGHTSIESADLSSYHMTFGQFLDHDITSTPMTKFDTLSYGTIIRCCDPKLIKGTQLTKDAESIGCAPIMIPKGDYFYSSHRQRCMEFLRSLPAGSVNLGPREQVNQQSAYLDGSVIYGIKPPVATGDPLRSFQDGLLKETVSSYGEQLLPVSMDRAMLCNSPDHMAKNEFCFLSGDDRVNEVPSLVLFHVVMAREHNRVAKVLKGLRPNATDEELYQESRRIVTAELQHVTYNEFIPTLVPPTLLQKHGLLPKTGRNQTTSYDPNMDVSIANSFATATYRFGHSEIPDNITMASPQATVSNEELSSLFNPFLLYRNNSVELLARGGCLLKALRFDSFFTKEVTVKLFRGNNSFGLDLLALNLQRGRDHGLPGYTKYLAKCGMPNVTRFEDLLAVMPYANMVALRDVYKNVADIDLYAGGISETPMNGGILGFTFTCLIVDQFKRIKFGDRFWYEEKNQAGSFTPEQIEQLHKTTFSRILCDNVPTLNNVQQFLMKSPGPQNPFVSCNCSSSSSIPCLDLSPWRI